jgi:ribosome assembly protein YihI (activator of Der GTPase)|tara:strand:+ start:570 stop:764 length:195 start_codon:yes stop_codon:yes gene_type:complete
MTFFELVDLEINDKHNVLLEALSAGHMKDYAEYRYVCGTIAGLLTAKGYISSIREKIEKEEGYE